MSVKWCIVKYSYIRIILNKLSQCKQTTVYANIFSIDFQENSVKNYPRLHVLFSAN